MSSMSPYNTGDHSGIDMDLCHERSETNSYEEGSASENAGTAYPGATLLLRRFNQFTGLVFLAYGGLVLIGREHFWDLFFAETQKVTPLSTFLTFAVGIALCTSGMFLLTTSLFPHDPVSDNLVLCAHWITWVAWVAFDWLYFHAYSPVFRYLNMICSNGILIILYFITVALYHHRKGARRA